MTTLLATDDTIAAIASARGGAPRGIVRITGPRAVGCVARCWTSAQDDLLTELRAVRVISGELRVDGPIGSVPCDLYVWPTSRSYTQQPSVEIHTVGSTPILDAVMRTICANGVRLAEPGEFTMRAFLAGRMDLTQAEAVLGVIDADSQKELNVALKQLAGGVGTPLNHLRDELLNLLAHLEAGLDFVEEDIEFISVEELTSQLNGLHRELNDIVHQMQSRSVAGDEIRVVLRGLPNTGKSSLLNALVDDDAAIVSDVSGTTRDYVTRRIEIDGVAFLLIDTAGVDDERTSRIDDLAQSHTATQQTDASIELLCIDATRPRSEWERRELARATSHTRVVVVTKVDLAETKHLPDDGVKTSAKTKLGLDVLRATLLEAAIAERASGMSVVANTASRCAESLTSAAASLQRAIDCATSSLGEELVAAELRETLDHLGKVVGAIYTDDVLDRIFSRFCIGK